MDREKVRYLALLAASLLLSSCSTDVSISEARSRPLLRFAVVGDMGPSIGDSGPDQLRVAKQMCRWRHKHPFNLVVTVGDNVYPDGRRRDFHRAFFKPYDCLLSNGVRFRAALGNHDVYTRNGRDELREPAFGMKGRNYVIRRGGVKLVFANSNDFKLKWLDQALKGRTARWKIAVFHHPVYSPSTDPSHDIKQSWLRGRLKKMFKQRGVDLVLNGHDHFYAATKPLKRLRYVVTGGGGRSIDRCRTEWHTALCEDEFHFVYVRAGQRSLFVRAISDGGRIFHRFHTTGRR